ncbi:MAG: hypothetical protein II304_07870 [Bacteroidales bacterium]|nr:hypothetical protein [Bacteroidales bacterium]
MTNYERIKNMSIEDLAYFLEYSVSENEDYYTMIHQKMFLGVGDIINWLESEVENNDS